jgi:hypothetical protein
VFKRFPLGNRKNAHESLTASIIIVPNLTSSLTCTLGYSGVFFLYTWVSTNQRQRAEPGRQCREYRRPRRPQVAFDTNRPLLDRILAQSPRTCIAASMPTGRMSGWVGPRWSRAEADGKHYRLTEILYLANTAASNHYNLVQWCIVCWLLFAHLCVFLCREKEGGTMVGWLVQIRPLRPLLY